MTTNSSKHNTLENQHQTPPTPKTISRLNRWYKDVSAKGLAYVVKPSLLGDLPDLTDGESSDGLTFYVLDEYSRANSLMLASKTDSLGLPNALHAVRTKAIDESSALIFLKHRRATKNQKVSPRLVRLIKAWLENQSLDIRLVPVTVLWGRAPDKEDSLFKLLMADEWRVPSLGKQLFNIGVMGRDSHVQFYNPKSLSMLIADAKAALESETDITRLSQEALAEQLALHIEIRLKGYLTKQRTSILGPDMSDRRNISGSILTSRQVQEAIEQKALETGKSIASVKKEALGYIDEIASDYSHSVVRVFDRFLTWLWTQLYDGVEVRHFERVRKLAPDYQIIYVPCHRSHMDYLLLAYVIYMRGLRVPYVAAGANLNIPILGELLRSGGAFFMRRSFRDNALYKAVFKAYFDSMMARNTPLEYFVEGGRSRSGRLLAPKYGLLAMTINSYLQNPAKPVVFIPAYLSYERIMEGATYIGELKGKSKESENLLSLIKTARRIERIFGTVHLSFGEPLYLDKFLDKFNIPNPRLADSQPQASDDEINAMITNIGVKIMQHINRAAVVNPVSLIALVLLSTPKAALDESLCLTQLDLYQRIAGLLPYDDDTFVTPLTPQQMLDYAKQLKLIERTPHILGDMIKVADKQAPLLNYFKNNILHVFILPSLVMALIQRNGRINKADLFEMVALIYPFLQAELFLKYALRNIESVLDKVIAALVSAGLLNDDGQTVSAPLGNTEAAQQVAVLASPAEQSLERYFMAIYLLNEQGSGKLTKEQAVELCYLLGGRLAVLYTEDSPDLFDKALFTSFINTLIRLGYVTTGAPHADVNIDGGDTPNQMTQAQIAPTSDRADFLQFDKRLRRIAAYARFVLNPEMMHLIRNVAKLSQDDINSVTAPSKGKAGKAS